jgi:hypothetical protein
MSIAKYLSEVLSRPRGDVSKQFVVAAVTERNSDFNPENMKALAYRFAANDLIYMASTICQINQIAMARMELRAAFCSIEKQNQQLAEPD